MLLVCLPSRSRSCSYCKAVLARQFAGEESILCGSYFYASYALVRRSIAVEPEERGL